jgi:hypothetical protein
MACGRAHRLTGQKTSDGVKDTREFGVDVYAGTARGAEDSRYGPPHRDACLDLGSSRCSRSALSDCHRTVPTPVRRRGSCGAV